MNDIAELERRITMALERIGAGIDLIGAAAAPAESLHVADGEAAARIAELQDALDSERTTNAQLTERVRAIKEKQETMVGALEKKVARLTQQVDAATIDLQRLKEANQDLADANRALGEAVEAGVADPGLINQAMLGELEALRAARAADVAEMDGILSELKPLIGEVA
jgi:chromosome segregation ATPase